MKKFDIIHGSSNFEQLATYVKFPVYMGCVDTPLDDDIFCDLEFEISKDSGVIQVANVPSPDLVYQRNHNDSTGKTWELHNSGFCEFILRNLVFCGLGDVLEIGGGNGKLAQEVDFSLMNCSSWNILDTNPLIESWEGVQVQEVWFDEHYKSEKKFDSIVHSNILEHALDPFSFLKKTYDILNVGGRTYISVPDLKFMVSSGYANALNFEHTIFLTDDILEYLFSKVGFFVVEKYKYMGGWVWYCLEKMDHPVKCDVFRNRYEEYRNLFLTKFVQINKEKIDRINRGISSHSGKVYLFGAHVFSQFLLSAGVRESSIDGLLDDSRLKNGLRLYGTNLVSEFSEVISKDTSPAVVLNVAQHRESIVNNLLEINPSVVFIE